MGWHSLPYDPERYQKRMEVKQRKEKRRDKIRGYPGWLRAEHKARFIANHREQREASRGFRVLQWTLQGDKALIHAETLDGRLYHSWQSMESFRPRTERLYKDIAPLTQRERAGLLMRWHCEMLVGAEEYPARAERAWRNEASATRCCRFCRTERWKQKIKAGEPM